MKSRVHPTYKTTWSDRLTIVPSECVSSRQGGRRHRDRGLTPCGVRPGCASAECEPPGRDERQCNGFPARSQQRPSRRGSGSTTSKCSITNDAGTRRLTRSVQRPLSDARAKKAWILWKTAKGAVSHRLHTRCLFDEKRTDNEERSTQRNRPLNRIMAKPQPSWILTEPHIAQSSGAADP